ncbi:M20/M25/M40 family metallo-hydrolase [Natrononativus amylolyticus]|uniref:M20/M25/M40 family metallo-hydrolase n=1 Tax=Natrononativus amylolyticus TaxID=2963434 RepID=UPI0020CC7F27|nr:M20/M25/M40 family metallo-hydrolase [Natrononativus amylolyticus]
MAADVTDAVEDGFERYRAALFDLLRQPSVSTTGEGMDVAPALVCDTLSEFGFEGVTQVETSRYPVVYAEHVVDEAAPTLLFYGHYDVQPSGDDAEWESPPFEPTVRDGSIYARGAGDNKGQFSAHVFAVHALREADAYPDVNVKLLLDGGEESGSAGFREYLSDEPAEITDADLVYVADGPMFGSATDAAGGSGARSQRPLIAYGNKGILSFQLDLRTARTDLHSGNFGGPVPNAATELVALLSSMREGDEITVEGFHDGIDVTDSDRRTVENIPVDEDAIRAELELSHLASDRPYYERLLLHPTLTINGLSSGYQGDGMKTVLPSRATAKLDCRLVPNQDPDEVFEAVRAHVTARHPDVEITKQGTFPPLKTPLEAPAAEPVEEALAAVWGQSPVVFPVLGGSLPAAYFREVPELADVPVVVVPYANPDQGNHSPNEHLDLDCFRNGIETSAEAIRRFAEI